MAGCLEGKVVVVTGAGRVHSRLREHPLDLIEVDAQPEQLHEATAPPDDLVQAVRRPARDVAGAELLDVPTAFEVPQQRTILSP